MMNPEYAYYKKVGILKYWKDNPYFLPDVRSLIVHISFFFGILCFGLLVAYVPLLIIFYPFMTFTAGLLLGFKWVDFSDTWMIRR